MTTVLVPASPCLERLNEMRLALVNPIKDVKDIRKEINTKKITI
jgi:hypothetical protein